MSYCRLSTPGCDFYIYHDGTRFHVSTALNRFCRKTRTYVKRHVPSAGFEWTADNYVDLIWLIRHIRRLGHRIPRKVFDRIKHDSRLCGVNTEEEYPDKG